MEPPQDYEDVVVLIPSHGLEDFPTDLGEESAAGMLNAFAVSWHPAILAATGSVPTWDRADEPPEKIGRRLVFIPEPAEEWLPGGWATRAETEGATVVRGVHDRDEMVRVALSGLGDVAEIDPDVVADFLALGHCNLQIELLTRQMHHFSNLDEAQLHREAVAAAKAAVAHDAEATRKHLTRCFEALHEARERFYPVDCFLLDLCLLIPDLADHHLQRSLERDSPFNLLLSGEDLEQVARKSPEIVETLRTGVAQRKVDVIGGEYREGPTHLQPLGSQLSELEHGHATYDRVLGRTPTTWARRRFGLTTLLPQLLGRFGFHSALHVVLDDGLYPDAEGAKVRWEGCDGSVIDAFTRIPLAADSASSFVRFAPRMAESMEQDQVAAICLARWPEVKGPWLDDLRRMTKYAPVLGRFVTFDEFITETDLPGRLSNYDESEYFSPFLVQSVARRETNPLSRYADHLQRRTAYETGEWLRRITAALYARPLGDERENEVERLVEAGAADGEPEPTAAATAAVADWVTASAGGLTEIVARGGETGSGFVVFNPQSFVRRIPVELPLDDPRTVAGGPVKAVQSDDRTNVALVEVPPCGYAWVPTTTDAAQAGEAVPTVVDNVIRNEFFEVHVNEATGGIRTIKEYGRRPNRLSQQLAFRFSRERIVANENPDAIPDKTWYSSMRCTGLDTVCDGPGYGQITTRGELIDPGDGTVIGTFEQSIRLWRGRRSVDVDISVDLSRTPEGGPWNEYLAARFAWNDPESTLTRSVLGGAHVVNAERNESLHYLELAGDEGRTTIVPHGFAFHRRTGPRMLDTLLVVEGESRRRFRFTIGIDEDYPMHVATDALVPPVVVPTSTAPPNGEPQSGWFLHLSAKNVLLTRLLPLVEVAPPAEQSESDGDTAPEPKPVPESGFAVRLVETEGRSRRVRLQAFKTPTYARQRDFTGRTVAELPIDGDAVPLSINPYEVADIELRFE